MKAYQDLAEQGSEQQDRVAKALSKVKHRVAVGSGKGGVGKSTVTRALAAALAARGFKVAIVDADFNGPAQDRMTGLRGAVPVPGVERGERALDARREGGQEASGDRPLGANGLFEDHPQAPEAREPREKPDDDGDASSQALVDERDHRRVS